jgi:hypothetical protein
MEGEIVYYDRSELDAWRPRPRALVQELVETDTTSPLGQLYAEWNAGNRQAIDEYERKTAAIERYEKARGL